MVEVDISGLEEHPDKTVASIEVPPGQTADTRLDVYLSRVLPNVTRSRVQQGIKEGRVTVNSAPAKASYVVHPGDKLRCVILRPPPLEAKPEPIPIDVVFEDDVLIVVNKPAGMVVHPAYGNRSGTMVNALLHHTQSNLSAGGGQNPQHDTATVRPGLVHRLDKGTSGLMVVAKDDSVHSRLSRQFSERTIDRLYEAIVWGDLEDAGVVETNLGRDPRDRKRMSVVREPNGKHAITTFEPLEPLTETTLVRFKLGTGRTHQIRVHAAHLGHPVFGDETYGGRQVLAVGLSKTKKRFFTNLFDKMPRQALHARTLGFTHPISGERVFFECELPPDMASVLEALRRGF
jgi:23S rRNA pseudouridine1911/1915/1917 synthase